MRTIVIAAILVASIPAASAQETLETYRRKAMAQDVEAQRETASCLRTGTCMGSPVPNAIEACAWRMVILGSSHGNIDAFDTANYRDECQALISDEERAAALTKAEELFRGIYQRELPADRLPP